MDERDPQFFEMARDITRYTILEPVHPDEEYMVPEIAALDEDKMLQKAIQDSLRLAAVSGEGASVQWGDDPELESLLAQTLRGDPQPSRPTHADPGTLEEALEVLLQIGPDQHELWHARLSKHVFGRLTPEDHAQLLEIMFPDGADGGRDAMKMD